MRSLTVPRGDMRGRVTGLHVGNATPLFADEGGRASGGGESEAETVGGRVITGPTCIVTEFRKSWLGYEGGK